MTILPIIIKKSGFEFDYGVIGVFLPVAIYYFKDKTIKAILVPNGAEQGRKFFDKMTEFAVQECEAKGLAWTKFEQDGTVQGGIAKFITEEAKAKLENEFGAKTDVVEKEKIHF